MAGPCAWRASSLIRERWSERVWQLWALFRDAPCWESSCCWPAWGGGATPSCRPIPTSRARRCCGAGRLRMCLWSFGAPGVSPSTTACEATAHSACWAHCPSLADAIRVRQEQGNPWLGCRAPPALGGRLEPIEGQQPSWRHSCPAATPCLFWHPPPRRPCSLQSAACIPYFRRCLPSALHLRLRRRCRYPLCCPYKQTFLGSSFWGASSPLSRTSSRSPILRSSKPDVGPRGHSQFPPAAFAINPRLRWTDTSMPASLPIPSTLLRSKHTLALPRRP